MHMSHFRTLNLQYSPKSALATGWRALFGQARTRILSWYLVLMAFFLAACIPMMQKFVIASVDARVQEDLEEDLAAFHQLLDEQSQLKARFQKNPISTPQELKEFFKLYFNWRIPEDDTFLIAFVDRKFFGASPNALPQRLQPEKDRMKRWSLLEQPQQGEEIVGGKTQSILYIAEPIRIEGKTLGVIVVAHITAGERKEAFETLAVVTRVMVWVLLATLVLTWWVAGRVLTPLRQLAQTAHAIGESDLTQRLSVQGSGEIAELATTFNEMMDRLQAAFASQREFVNDAGHELRTPITIIHGHLELMGDDPAEQRETLALVMDELERMGRLVNDLLLLARAERPDFLHLETIEIGGLIEEIYAKATALADRNWQLEAVCRGKMELDRQRITEAILNLAHNATQYTQVGDSISIGVSVDRHHAYFWVKDTGEGIPLNEQKRIFDRFVRASGVRRRLEGSGLGLSIVQAIVEAHRGKVNLQSQPGIGSTFSLILPFNFLVDTLDS
jgi:signal transduction histidine kinase